MIACMEDLIIVVNDQRDTDAMHEVEYVMDRRRPGLVVHYITTSASLLLHR